MIQRLKNGQSLLGEEERTDPRLRLRAEPKLIGDRELPWHDLDDLLEEQTKSLLGGNKERADLDLDLLDRLCDLMGFLEKRDAGDRGVWEIGTVIEHRQYVHARWGASSDRYLGPVTRNAFAHLWWTAEALGERSANSRPCCERLFDQGDARLRLWVIDFEPFYGRPALARAAVDHCIANGIRGDKAVDSFFKAFGGLAATSDLDLLESDPAALFDQVAHIQKALTFASTVP
jgi:hypothetical protein